MPKHLVLIMLLYPALLMNIVSKANADQKSHSQKSENVIKPEVGTMQFWNGKSWITIPNFTSHAKTEPSLHLCEGVPTWVLYSCPGSSPYEIGETGPAGGRVFYISDGGLHGLEAAPEDLPIRAWGCEGKAIKNASGVAIGTGSANTKAVIAGCDHANAAVKQADNYYFNGYEDWYLPSKDELTALYNNIGPNAPAPLSNIGHFSTTTYYWSSSEIGPNHAWTVFFANGEETFGQKMNPSSARAIRAF